MVIWKIEWIPNPRERERERERSQMESKEKVELIQVAIQKLIEEQREKKLSFSPDASSFVVTDDGGGDGDDDHLLSKLLFQLETLKRDGKLQQSEPLGDPEEQPSSLTVGDAESEIANEVVDGATDDSEREEILKDLRKVKRQNFITHCLLSVMIVLTVAWQLSEVSLILKVKDGLSHPFRCFGGLFAGMLRKDQGPIAIANDQNGQLQLEATPLPPLQIPELPNLDLSWGTHSDEE